MKTILIVDDERIVRKGIEAILLSEGYAVKSVRDGAEAVEKLKEHSPDLVLMDVMMPRLNGYQACAEIRRIDPTVPVLFLTARNETADQVRGFEVGADDFIDKDAPEAVLLARIRRALQRAESVDMGASSVKFGKVLVNFDTLTARFDRQELKLTATEAGILRLLIAHRGVFMTTDDLVTGLRGQGVACGDGLIYTHVYNLRRKLGPAGALLMNSRRNGYKILSVK